MILSNISRVILYFLSSTLISVRVIGATPELHASFSVEVLNADIYTYECYVVVASLLVHPQNDAPIQFYRLGEQIQRIAEKLAPEQAWKHDNGIIDVEPISINKDGQAYYQYKIIELGVCPIDSGTFTIPPLELTVAKTNLEGEMIDSVTLLSEARHINVRPLPEGIADSVYSNDTYCMVGKYRLEENNPNLRRNQRLGDTINYQLTISGRGTSFPIGLYTKQSDDVEIIVKEAVLKDTVQYRALRTKKTFHLQIIPWRKDTLRLGDYIEWSYYASSEDRVKSIRPSQKFLIWGKEKPRPPATTVQDSIDIVLIMDVSASMMIQDYGLDDRLTVGIDLINQMAVKKPETPIILFSGEAYIWGTQLLDYDLMNRPRPRGTAIGNALWMAKEILKKSTSQNKRIVLVYDGDDTKSSVSEVLAAQICRQYNIKVDCIGLGHRGIVPFGYDLLGQVRYVDNSFQDASLKKVASITGGQYIWMNDTKEISKIVSQLFP